MRWCIHWILPLLLSYQYGNFDYQTSTSQAKSDCQAAILAPSKRIHQAQTCDHQQVHPGFGFTSFSRSAIYSTTSKAPLPNTCNHGRMEMQTMLEGGKWSSCTLSSLWRKMGSCARSDIHSAGEAVKVTKSKQNSACIWMGLARRGRCCQCQRTQCLCQKPYSAEAQTKEEEVSFRNCTILCNACHAYAMETRGGNGEGARRCFYDGRSQCRNGARISRSLSKPSDNATGCAPYCGEVRCPDRYWQQKPWALRPFKKHAEREQHFHTTMAPMTLHGTMIGFTNKIFLVVLVISIRLKNNLNTFRTWPMHSRKEAQLNIKQKDVSFMS